MPLATRPEVEVPVCPMCSSAEYDVAIVEPPHHVMRCKQCGFGWVTPRLDEQGLAAIYTDDTYWRSQSPKVAGYADYRGSERLYMKTFRRRLDYVLHNGPHAGKALDVGSAAGFCMQALAERGFEAYGVEPSRDIAGHARDRFGFETVHAGTLETAPYAPNTFDLVTMWDVVEHVVDPRALLAKAHELLKPEGTLVLETQNIDSGFARLLGRSWHHYKHDEHIYHFNPATITSLLRAVGFAPQKVTPRFGGKYVSADFIAERASRLHPSLTKLLQPLTRLGARSLYINVMDEIIVIARPVATT